MNGNRGFLFLIVGLLLTLYACSNSNVDVHSPDTSESFEPSPSISLSNSSSPTDLLPDSPSPIVSSSFELIKTVSAKLNDVAAKSDLKIGWIADEDQRHIFIVSIDNEDIEPVLVEPIPEQNEVLLITDLRDVICADLDGDGTDELSFVFGESRNGGKGGAFLTVFKYLDNSFKRLAMPTYLRNSDEFTVKRKDENSAEVTCLKTDFRETLNLLHANDEQYKSYMDGWVDPINNVKKVTINNKIFLETNQYTCFGSHVDGIGEIVTLIYWDNDSYHIESQKIVPYGQ